MDPFSDLYFFLGLTDSDFWFTKIVGFNHIWLVVNTLGRHVFSLHNHKFALATTSAINLRLFINHRRGKSKDKRKTMQSWLITIQATFSCKGLEIQGFGVSNPFIVATWWSKPVIFKTMIIWYNRIHSMKYMAKYYCFFSTRFLKTPHWLGRVLEFIGIL